ncbi:MAG: hypothetical protein ACOCUF_02160 [Patescibacteria group bacterium]
MKPAQACLTAGRSGEKVEASEGKTEIERLIFGEDKNIVKK